MYKLSGLDAGFLYNETASCPQHVASLQLLELPEGMAVDAFIIALKKLLMERIHLVPYFTNRLAITPFALDHPVWETDPDFDIDNHVSRYAIAAPGGRSQWEAAVAKLHEQPFDRRRPLWRIAVLTSLENGRIAYYNAVHHACIDGVAAQAALALLMDTELSPRAVSPAGPDFFKPHHCSWPELLSAAHDNLVKAQVRQSTQWLKQLETGLRLQRRLLDGTAGFGALTETAPVTRFNRSISNRRAFATSELPVAIARRISKTAGCTVNDVFLAVCGGGLRRYLERCGELPAESLIAGCPVSLRRPADKSIDNMIAIMQVTLATGEANPANRLMRIAISSKKAKSVTADLAGVIDSNPVTPGLPWLMQRLAAYAETNHMANGAPVAFNLVVSNVPGPRQTLYSAGARMLTHYPASIPVHGMGVNITAQRYEETLFVGITACADMLPDIGVLRDDLLDELAALQNMLLAPKTHPTPSPVLPRSRLDLAEALPSEAPEAA